MFRRQARSEPRLSSRKLANVEISTQSADGDWSAVAQGQLCDMSRGGAKMIVDQPVTLQSSVVVRLRKPDLHLDLEVTGEVCWVAPADGADFAVGCTFVPDLPTDILEKLFSSGLLERRIFRRRALKIPATAQWELDASSTDAFLWDLSEGGFCVLSPLSRPTGRRLLLTVATERGKVAIPAKTQWTLKVGEGYVVGCEFMNKEGYMTLSDLEAIANGTKAAAKSDALQISDQRNSLGRKFQAVIDCFLKTPAN